MMRLRLSFFFFFFNDTATTEIYTLSLHDALPIYEGAAISGAYCRPLSYAEKLVVMASMLEKVKRDGELKNLRRVEPGPGDEDRKSTRLNSSHLVISYAVFCLKKKNSSAQSAATYL